MKHLLIMSAAALVLAACSQGDKAAEPATKVVKEVVTETVEMAGPSESSTALAAILDAQDDKAKARYDARHPQETLEFFGIEPGMTVAEALPGGGWYSKILIPYLGNDGTLIGVDYAIEMWPEFGGFATEEFIEKKKTWPETWVAGAEEWRAGSEGDIKAFAFGNRDAALDGTVDAVLFIRAMHNLSRFEEKGGYMTKALADAYALLKPGGIVGIVQHQGPEGNSDEWASGSNGYLKKSAVIAKMKAAGFELVAESGINENAKDVPSEEDMVWRLPPTLGTSKEDPELKATLEAVGESNRMTLLFKKV